MRIEEPYKRLFTILEILAVVGICIILFPALFSIVGSLI